MKTVLFPSQRVELGDWLEANRESAFEGNRESQIWKEWYCLFKLVNLEVAESFFPKKFKATWLDDDGQPDFAIESDIIHFKLEVTEATTQTDRRAIVALRNIDTPHLIGDDILLADGSKVNGGRAISPNSERDMVGDIKSAIIRKSSKKYASGAALLVYPNSNVRFAQVEEVLALWNRNPLRHPFINVIVLWPTDAMIHVSGETGFAQLIRVD